MLFDWDAGNWPKCGKHGVDQAEIEEVFKNDPMVFSDPLHSAVEQRFRPRTAGTSLWSLPFAWSGMNAIYGPSAPGTCMQRRSSTMSAPKGKRLPPLLSDEEAERFVENSDLTRYDLSGGVPLSAFEFQAKSASVHMRMPQAQLAEIKAEAERRGMPYQRLMRELLQRGLNTLKAS